MVDDQVSLIRRVNLSLGLREKRQQSDNNALRDHCLMSQCRSREAVAGRLKLLQAAESLKRDNICAPIIQPCLSRFKPTAPLFVIEVSITNKTATKHPLLHHLSPCFYSLGQETKYLMQFRSEQLLCSLSTCSVRKKSFTLHHGQKA